MLVISYKLFRIPRMVFLNAKKTNLAVSFNLAIFEVQTKVEQNPRVCWQIFTPENACTSPVLSIWPIIGKLLIWAKNPIAKPFSSPSRHLRWRARLKVFKTIHYFCNFRQMNNRIMISVQWWCHERYLWCHICCDDVISPPIVLGAYSLSTQNQKQRLLRSGIFNFCVKIMRSWDHWMVLTSSI